MTSSFLVPQTKIDSPFDEIESTPIITVERNYFSKQNNEVITQNYFDLLEQQTFTFGPNDPPFSPEIFPKESNYNGYTWTQHNNVITITYKSPEPVSNDSIIITENDISSPFLSGNFYGKVLSNEILVSNNNIIITLHVEKKFPILIKSGKMDKISLFFLAILASKIGQDELFVKLLIKSSMHGFHMAMTSLAYHYIEESQKDHAFYWFYQYAINSDDTTPYIPICQILLDIDSEKYANLVENILVKIANKTPPAYIQLALLHIGQINGFNSNPQLAVQYLEFAIRNFNSEQAVKLLATMYLEGDGVERNPEKAKQILIEGGSEPHKVDMVVNEYLKRIPIEDDSSIVDKIADYSIAALLVAGAAAAAVYAFNFFKNRTKK